MMPDGASSGPKRHQEECPGPEVVALLERGEARELSIGGTTASFYQQGQVLTGSVWDALGISVLALPKDRRGQILLLGLGGGSAARIMRVAAPEARIVGVELDASVVRVARESMALASLNLEVVIDEASHFLGQTQQRYDLIMEDCFVGGEGGLTKPGWVLRGGLEAMQRKLSPQGVLVVDAVHEGAEIRATLKTLFPHLVCVTLFDCTNEVFIATEGPLSARQLRRAVVAHPSLGDAVGNLTFRTL